MKKFAKVIALMLTLCMVFCLCACGADKDTKSEKKITIFQQKAEIAEQLQALAKEYTKETGVEVEVWAQAGDDYYANLKTSLSSESGPTIFTLNSDAEITEVKDYLADLFALSFIGDIDSTLLAVRDEKTVGIPMTAEGFGLVYNADLVDPAALTDMDALCAMIAENGKGLTTVGLSQEDYFLAGHMFNFPFALQKDPVAFCQQVMAGEVKLADVPEFQQYAKLLSAIRANQVNPVEVTYDNNCGDFATGKTAMVHQGNWAYGVIKDFEPAFEMGITGVPINGNDKIAVGVPSVWAVNADASDEEQQLAMDFLNWLYTSETGIHYMMDEFGFIPVVKGMENENMDPLSAAVAEKISTGDILPWTFNTEWPAGIISVDLAPITQEFFTSDMSEADFLNAINDAFLKYAE
ncbi:MAG: ABC transporter substrate-binding protein [Bacillota bacterium]|nr:ABC transporter substrate-binding protein [Bacillota bacterium]